MTMPYHGRELLNGLSEVPWEVAARVYGNDHATLIGLLVTWWIARAPSSRWVLEGGPTNGYRGRGKRGQCDALLCENGSAVGLLEVEGSRYEFTIRKIDRFFDAKYKEIATLEFAILLLYTYEARGRGTDRGYDPVSRPEVLDAVAGVTRTHRGKPLVVVTLDKLYERTVAPIRTRNDYYKGATRRFEGLLFVDGVLKGRRLYFERRAG